MIKAGHIFNGPDGQGYKLNSDLNVGDVIRSDLFVPLGGAPKCRGGESIPTWLASVLESHGEQVV